MLFAWWFKWLAPYRPWAWCTLNVLAKLLKTNKQPSQNSYLQLDCNPFVMMQSISKDIAFNQYTPMQTCRLATKGQKVSHPHHITSTNLHLGLIFHQVLKFSKLPFPKCLQGQAHIWILPFDRISIRLYKLELYKQYCPSSYA